MPRANRHYLPGYIWHITHRCHKKEFLLKFASDQRRWLYWLFEAKKRFGTSILNYAVTSNHIHLEIKDDKGEEVIPRTMQLIAGRTGQEYNQRKDRKCLVYVDLNMVRAGVVNHPSEWPFCGYNEIQNPRQRYSMIDHESLMNLFDAKCIDELKKIHRDFWEDALQNHGRVRDTRWVERIAVGCEAFVRDTKERLGIRAMGRQIMGDNGTCELRESEVSYDANFHAENGVLRQENAFYWDVFTEKSTT